MRKLVVLLSILALAYPLAACEDEGPYKLVLTVGKPVYSSTDEQIGSIDEIILDMEGHQFAIVTVGDFLGLGGKQVLISSPNLSARPEGGFYVNYSAERLAFVSEHPGSR